MALTHLDENGEARMVDVSAKAVTDREAEACARVCMKAQTLALLKEGAAKGDVLAVARVAAIQAAKKTADLIPLCHPIPLSSVEVHFETNANSVEVQAIVRCSGKTGVEMEALTAASVAALTIYDMLKAVERGMTIEGVKVVRKAGGRSGTWTSSD